MAVVSEAMRSKTRGVLPTALGVLLCENGDPEG